MSHGKWLVHASALGLAGALATVQAGAVGASVDSATKAQLKTATEHYDRGVDAMDGEKFALALTHFQRSYDTVASPNSRMMVGRALVKLGKLPEAYRELSQALRQATDLASTQKRYKKTVQTVQKELDEIKDKLSYVTIRQDAQLELQGETVAPANWQELQPVMPGTVNAVVSFSDGRKIKKQLTLKAGERAELTVDPPTSAVVTPATATNGPMAPAATAKAEHTSDLNRRTVGYVVGAVGIVGVGTFVGLSLVAASIYGNSKADCIALSCPESGIDNETPKATLRGVGYAGLGVGVLGLGVGTWLILSGGTKAEPTTALRIGPASLQLAHQF